jgi:hypothetical protein
MKYTFMLKGINIEEIQKKFELITPSNILVQNTSTSAITKICDLSLNKDDLEFKPFIDENKVAKLITMYDYVKNDYLPNSTDIKCFWCRNSFDTIPLGCPLKYHSSQLEKIYFSDITKDRYVIIENISKDKKINIQNHNQNDSKKKEKLNIIEKEFYETDGIFCSFNCCLAFINDNKLNSIYKNSANLLKKIYYDTYNMVPESIIPSPSFRVLKEYGGFLTIEEFRKNFNKIEYIDNGYVKNLIKFKPMGINFIEKSKL